MEHNFTGRDGLPILFLVNKEERQISFASDDLVMSEDTVVGYGLRGTIKEVIEERPAKGNYESLGHIPTFYKVQLY